LNTTKSENWSGRFTFILASVGAAVGLGNIWKFPYTLGNSGGSAFVLVYVLAILLVATPIMLSEMLIGRHARQSAPTAMRKLAVDLGGSSWWQIVGWMGLLALLFVLSFYSVIAGWTIAYLAKSISGGLSGRSPQEVAGDFGTFLHDPGWMILWHFLFTAATVIIVSRGIRLGLEKLVVVLMPALFLMLLALVIYSGVTGDFARTVDFLFSADLSKVTPVVVLAAVGQAFFSVNVGVGAVLTYAAYLPDDVNLFRSAITVSIGDTLVAVLAGLAIFPIVFAHGLNPSEGPGLVFVTLSTAFAEMPGGSAIATLFFLMLLFAALTSSISMLETMTARACEVRGLPRPAAASMIGVVAFLLGLITVLSFSTWENVFPLGQFKIFASKTPFDLIDYAVSNVLMPIGGMLYALFAGWWVSRKIQVTQLGIGDGAIFKLWLVLVRLVAPLAIATVFVYNLA
jgi:neurotransmitter:Na+ symporter, NSS family